MLTAILYIITMGLGFYLSVFEGYYLIGFELILLGIILSRVHNAEIYAEQAKIEAEQARKDLLALHNKYDAVTEGLSEILERIERKVQR